MWNFLSPPALFLGDRGWIKGEDPRPSPLSWTSEKGIPLLSKSARLSSPLGI